MATAVSRYYGCLDPVEKELANICRELMQHYCDQSELQTCINALQSHVAILSDLLQFEGKVAAATEHVQALTGFEGSYSLPDLEICPLPRNIELPDWAGMEQVIGPRERLLGLLHFVTCLLDFARDIYRQRFQGYSAWAAEEEEEETTER